MRALSYPKGQERFDTVRDDGGDAEGVEAMIAAVALPAMDPVGGAQGPLTDEWR